MRRKERIPEILKKIEEVWLQHEDQRLGQLLENYFGYPRTDIFYVEDDTFGVKVFDNPTKELKKLAKGMKKVSKALEKKYWEKVHK